MRLGGVLVVKHKNELTFKTNGIIALNNSGRYIIARFMCYMYHLGNSYFGFTKIPKYDNTFFNWCGTMVTKK